MAGTPSRRELLQVMGVAGLGASAALAGCSAPEQPKGDATSARAVTAASTATPTPSGDGVFRFATASDGHLGEPKTDSRRYLKEFVAALNRVDAATPLEFVVVNGDIGHGGVTLLEEAKQGLGALSAPLLATQGNHDQVSAADWTRIWGTPANVVRRFGERSVVCANTSNLAGDYLCADETWLERALQGEAGQRDVFVFMHITPNTWTRFGVACPQVRDVLAGAANVRAVFNGHDHDQTGVKVDQGVHYVFDAHYGGHWGTSYRAFRVVEVEASRLVTWLVTTAGERLAETSIAW